MMMIALYVDNIVFAAKTAAQTDLIKDEKKLGNQLKMKDLGEAKV